MSNARNQQTVNALENVERPCSQPDRDIPPVENRCDSAEQGPAGTLEMWLEAMRPRLVRLAGQFVNNRSDAEEIAQEALTLVWQRAATFKDAGCRNAWVYRVTINLSLNLRRSRLRADRRLRNPKTWSGSIPNCKTSGASAENGELVDKLREVLEELPDRQRAALVLREMEGLEYDQIAAILEIRPAAVRVLVHRGREALRRRLLAKWPNTFG